MHILHQQDHETAIPFTATIPNSKRSGGVHAEAFHAGHPPARRWDVQARAPKLAEKQ